MKRLAYAPVLIMVALAGLLAACATNPVSIAETPAQKAYALESAYNIVLERAADVAADSATPATLRSSIQAAERKTTPVVDGLSNAFAQYQVVAAQVDQGATPPEKLTIAASNLADWVSRAEQALVQLSTAVQP